jgi:hypothetical protein
MDRISLFLEETLSYGHININTVDHWTPPRQSVVHIQEGDYFVLPVQFEANINMIRDYVFDNLNFFSF